MLAQGFENFCVLFLLRASYQGKTTRKQEKSMRLQLALNVRDLDEAVAYYAKLFDTQPHKRRPALEKP